MMPPAWLADRSVVYYVYDVDGGLIYVGATMNLPQRMIHHRTKSHWASLIHRLRVRVFLSERAAYEVEWAEIQRLRPRFNIQGRGTRCEWQASDYVEVLLSYEAMPWRPLATNIKRKRLADELTRRFPAISEQVLPSLSDLDVLLQVAA